MSKAKAKAANGDRVRLPDGRTGTVIDVYPTTVGVLLDAGPRLLTVLDYSSLNPGRHP